MAGERLQRGAFRFVATSVILWPKQPPIRSIGFGGGVGVQGAGPRLWSMGGRQHRASSSLAVPMEPNVSAFVHFINVYEH